MIIKTLVRINNKSLKRRGNNHSSLKIFLNLQAEPNPNILLV